MDGLLFYSVPTEMKNCFFIQTPASWSLCLHHWRVSDCGMSEKLFIVNYGTEAFFFRSPLRKYFGAEELLEARTEMHTHGFY